MLVIFLHPYIVYALSAARVCGKKTPFHTWQKRQIHPFLLLFGHDQDKFDAPHFLHRGVSVAQGNRHTPETRWRGEGLPCMEKLRVPPRHSILRKANHYMISNVRRMHTYYRCGKVADTQKLPSRKVQRNLLRFMKASQLIRKPSGKVIEIRYVKL